MKNSVYNSIKKQQRELLKNKDVTEKLLQYIHIYVYVGICRRRSSLKLFSDYQTYR